RLIRRTQLGTAEGPWARSFNRRILGVTYRVRLLRFNRECAPEQRICVIVGRLGNSARPDAEWETIRRAFRLTPRQWQVTQLLYAGASTADIAGKMGVTVHTARRHVEAVLQKIGVRHRAAAIARIREFRAE